MQIMHGWQHDFDKGSWNPLHAENLWPLGLVWRELHPVILKNARPDFHCSEWALIEYTL